MSTSDDDYECSEQPATREAARWWVRGHCGDLNPAERYALVRWLKASPMHVAEILHTVRIYLSLESARPLHNVNEDEFAQVIPLRTWATRPVPPRSPLRPRVVAIAATAVVVIGLWLSVNYFTHIITTEANEWHSFQLADGSSITVGPRTRLRYSLDDRQRRIELAYGEVLVQVAKDPVRAFFVEAGPAVIRATGTQFAVDRRTHGLRVTLAEGSVVVDASAGSSRSSPVTLRPGEELRITGDAPATIRRVDAARSLAWASRMIVFDDETIERAVAEFNRRNRIQIEIPASISAREVRGAYHIDDPESFARAVAIATKRKLAREELVLRIGDAETADR